MADGHPRHGFAARRYGCGWGPPQTREGRPVMPGFAALAPERAHAGEVAQPSRRHCRRGRHAASWRLPETRLPSRSEGDAMLRASLLLSLPILASTAVLAQDPVVTDGDKYTLQLENDRVRVLRYHDRPGERTHQHVHPDFVLYALAPFKRRLTFPDGRTASREFKAGEVIFMKGQTHIGENIGDTDTDVVIVELKPSN
jgi:hypothetical protein